MESWGIRDKRVGAAVEPAIATGLCGGMGWQQKLHHGDDLSKPLWGFRALERIAPQFLLQYKLLRVKSL